MKIVMMKKSKREKEKRLVNLMTGRIGIPKVRVTPKESECVLRKLIN
jgi:hypothetical protein